jgi:hypothetical protein
LPNEWPILELCDALDSQLGLTEAITNSQANLGRGFINGSPCVIWQKGILPRLKVQEDIRNKTLSELEEIFAQMLQFDSDEEDN